MRIEVTVPDEWAPGLTLARRQLLRRAVRDGWPLVTCQSHDATAEQIGELDQQIRALVPDSGLAA
jgi:hypothetical protein